jgi:hypothetical protein
MRKPDLRKGDDALVQNAAIVAGGVHAKINVKYFPFPIF